MTENKHKRIFGAGTEGPAIELSEEDLLRQRIRGRLELMLKENKEIRDNIQKSGISKEKWIEQYIEKGVEKRRREEKEKSIRK